MNKTENNYKLKHGEDPSADEYSADEELAEITAVEFMVRELKHVSIKNGRCRVT